MKNKKPRPTGMKRRRRAGKRFQKKKKKVAHL
jgi:hypothetical protein